MLKRETPSIHARRTLTTSGIRIAEKNNQAQINQDFLPTPNTDSPTTQISFRKTTKFSAPLGTKQPRRDLPAD